MDQAAMELVDSEDEEQAQKAWALFCLTVPRSRQDNDKSSGGKQDATDAGTAVTKDPLENVAEGVTIEEITKWSQHFDRLMNATKGRRLFKDFLKGEFSDENILFWQACEDLKKEKNPEVVEEKARLIYEDYISILSPKEVSLDSQVRDIVNRKMVSPGLDTFNEAQLQIYMLMKRDSYPRFVNSPVFKRIREIVARNCGQSLDSLPPPTAESPSPDSAAAMETAMETAMLQGRADSEPSGSGGEGLPGATGGGSATTDSNAVVRSHPGEAPCEGSGAPGVGPGVGPGGAAPSNSTGDPPLSNVQLDTSVVSAQKQLLQKGSTEATSL